MKIWTIALDYRGHGAYRHLLERSWRFLGADAGPAPVRAGTDSWQVFPTDPPGGLRGNDRQPLLPARARHRLPLLRLPRRGTAQTDDEVVTHQTKMILGVDCTVVRDTVSQHGHPIERTFDWYAQDKQGDVWYMGELSLELRNGQFVRASDSWQSGVRRRQAGDHHARRTQKRRPIPAGVLPTRRSPRPGARARTRRER